MTDFQTWLFGIVSVSIAGSILLAVSDKTAGYPVMKLCVSLALIVSVLLPLRKRYEFLTLQLPKAFSTANYTESTNQRILSETEMRLSAYFEEEALEKGIECSADVSCVYDADNRLAPIHCEIICAEENFGAAALEKIAQQDLGLSETQISYIKSGDENGRKK